VLAGDAHVRADRDHARRVEYANLASRAQFVSIGPEQTK